VLSVVAAKQQANQIENVFRLLNNKIDRR